MPQGLFNPSQIRHLMAAEFDRSKRFGTPLAFLQIGVDRLGYLHDLYGEESRAEILGAMNELLRSSTRSSDLLGYPEGDRILAAVPHIEAAHAEALANRLVSGARGLTFEADGRTLRVTVSIGMSHSEDGADEFIQMVTSAREAMSEASAKGGDRFLRSSLPEPIAPTPAAPASASPQFTDMLLAESLKQALSGEGGGAGATLAKELLAKILDEVENRFQGPEDTEDARHDVLERRVAKLGEMLERTESQLRRVLDSGGAEGVASIYHDVQGLSADESNVEQKRELLTAIFDANLRMKALIEENEANASKKK